MLPTTHDNALYIIRSFATNVTEAVPALLIILIVGVARVRRDTPLMKWSEMQMAIAYSSNAVKVSTMFKVGMVSDMFRLILLIMLGPLLTNILF